MPIATFIEIAYRPTHDASSDFGAPPAASCSVFLDRLATLRFSDWLDIGCEIEPGTHASRAAAREMVRGIVSVRGLDFDVWFAHDTIETLVFLAAHSVPRMSRAEARAIATARLAAETAAMALIARGFMPRAAYEELVAPAISLLVAPFPERSPHVGRS